MTAQSQRTISDAEARVLAERAYPGFEPSRFCSRHRSSQPPVVSCTICFPDLPALLREHVRVHHQEQAQIAELKLGGRPMTPARDARTPGDITEGKTNSEHVEIPTRNLPTGVGPASYCPSMLRTVAEAHNRGYIHEPLEVKPWVVLTLLDAVSDYEGLRQVAGDAMDDRDALVAKLERLPQLLKDHYLTGITCDPIKKMDWPTCQCSMVDLGWHPSIGEAVDAWVAHLLKELGDE